MARYQFKKILVTGSSGFIGGWVARTLVEGGYKIRALYRRRQMPEHLVELRKAGAEVERRDLTVRDDVRMSLQNVDAVIHCAALARDWGHRREFRIHNLEVSKTLVDEARLARDRARCDGEP